MSILSCIDCGCFLDTDADPDVFREEMAGEPLCDACFYERLEAEDDGETTIQDSSIADRGSVI